MKTILVEFCTKDSVDYAKLSSKIWDHALAGNLEMLDECQEVEERETTIEYWKISTKMTDEFANFIKLQDPFLAERMHVSQISDELKDKYRQ